MWPSLRPGWATALATRPLACFPTAPAAAWSPPQRVRPAARGGSGTSFAGRPPVSVAMPPVSSTSSCCSISRRKFCLCRRRPASASTVRCNWPRREGRRHQLEHQRAVFDLAAQPGDAGGQDAAMVVRHRLPGHRAAARPPAPARPPTASRNAAAPGPRSRCSPSVPKLIVIRLPPLPAQHGVRRGLGPCQQRRGHLRRPRRIGFAPVLPREIAVPALPADPRPPASAVPAAPRASARDSDTETTCRAGAARWSRSAKV